MTLLIILLCCVIPTFDVSITLWTFAFLFGIIFISYFPSIMSLLFKRKPEEVDDSKSNEPMYKPKPKDLPKPPPDPKEEVIEEVPDEPIEEQVPKLKYVRPKCKIKLKRVKEKASNPKKVKKPKPIKVKRHLIRCCAKKVLSLINRFIHNAAKFIIKHLRCCIAYLRLFYRLIRSRMLRIQHWFMKFIVDYHVFLRRSMQQFTTNFIQQFWYPFVSILIMILVVLHSSRIWRGNITGCPIVRLLN